MDFIYSVFFVVGILTVSLFFYRRIMQQKPTLLQHEPEVKQPSAEIGDVVRVEHYKVVFWGKITRIDGLIYTVIVSNVEPLPKDLDENIHVPSYGETVNILDPHITYIFRAPVAA